MGHNIQHVCGNTWRGSAITAPHDACYGSRTWCCPSNVYCSRNALLGRPAHLSVRTIQCTHAYHATPEVQRPTHARSIDATGTRSFEDLTRHVIGKWNARCVEISIIVFQYGTLIAYTVAIGDILHPLILMPYVQEHAPWLTRDLVIILFWAFAMM